MNLGISVLLFGVGGAFGSIVTALLVAQGQREKAAGQSIDVEVADGR